MVWVVENMYFNVFICKMFRASASDIALMVTASADIFQAALIVLAVVIAGLAVWLPRMLESKA